MSSIWQVIVFSLVGGAVSLIGGIALLSSKKQAKLTEYATSFAAGALLAAAFVDIIPEAMEDGNAHTVSLFILLGLVAFFVFESTLNWFHHHHKADEKCRVDAVVPMIIIGDTVHNFIDGIAIAAGFLASPSAGIIVTLAVAAHEIPQEIGDFGLLLHKGIKRGKVLLINILSALATSVAAVVFFVIGESVEISFEPLLAIVAGFFIYIAASDLIPNIHHEKDRKKVLLQSLVLLVGVAIVWLVVSALHGVIE